ncbi:MAG: hypothetical protein IJE10_05865 [Clostridia bacterium]|nr:hypothetical protein [Clostridia bacterium]
MDIIGVIIINLFLVPFISMVVSANRSGKQIKCTMEFWVRYGCYVAWLVPLAKIAATCLEKAIGQPVELYSGYYTLGAVVIATLLPYVAEIFGKIFNVKCTIQKHEKE